MKKIILILFIILIGSAAFSQESTPPLKQNTVALHATLLGFAVNYERSFNNHLSLLGDTSLNVFPPTFTAAVKGRLYPFGKTFYLEMGVGYGLTVGYIGLGSELLIRSISLGFLSLNQNLWLNGVVFTPSLGWKIKLGKDGMFNLPINLGIDFFAGYRELSIPFDVVPNLRIGFGYSF